MAKTYIPRGTIERHDNITTDALVVNGRLIVKGMVRAARICGRGVIEAGTIRATSIVADTLDTERISARTVIANRIMCYTADVSGGIIARDCIEAVEVKTGRLSAAITNIERLRAKEVIETSPKSGFLRIIFTSWITERFMRGRHRKTSRKTKPLPIPDGTAPKVYTPIETEYNSVVTAYREKYLTDKHRLVLESVESSDIRKTDAA